MSKTVTITCRYCERTREVPAYYAGRYVTCGSDACNAKRIAHRAAAAKAANTGRKQSAEERQRKSDAAKGRKHTPEHTAAIVASRQATGWFKTPDIGERISAGLKGKPRPERRGPGNPNWQGGISKLPQGHRRSQEYANWRTAVLERDGHTCTQCGETTHVIAHHIQGWHEYPDLRADVENGIALCRRCHTIEHRLIDNLPKQAGPWPHRPAVTTILCRYCGAPRYVPTKSAHRYSTCGSAECVRQRTRDGLATRNQAGSKNPRYRHGRYINVEHQCPSCGKQFTAPAARKFCSLECSGVRGKQLRRERLGRDG